MDFLKVLIIDLKTIFLLGDPIQQPFHHYCLIFEYVLLSDHPLDITVWIDDSLRNLIITVEKVIKVLVTLNSNVILVYLFLFYFKFF